MLSISALQGIQTQPAALWAESTRKQSAAALSNTVVPNYELLSG